MHFWRIDSLKDELRRAPLTQRAAFGYLLSTLLLYTFSAAPSGSATDPQPITALDWTGFAAFILLVGCGTYAAYLANGGPVGVDFVPRYIAIGWVLGIRFIVMLFVPALVLFVGTALAWPEDELSDGATDRAAIAFGLGFEALYYWRLVSHVREIATSAPGETGMRESAGFR